jgi:hypothetical protein
LRASVTSTSARKSKTAARGGPTHRSIEQAIYLRRSIRPPRSNESRVNPIPFVEAETFALQQFGSGNKPFI